MDIETPLTIERGPHRLAAVLHRPAGEQPLPAVLFLHGFTGSKMGSHRLFVEVARVLSRAGIASLRIDFMGSGDSSGCFSECTVDTQLADARAALNWLRADPSLDSERIGLLGMSLGGLCAARLLGCEPELNSSVLLCPVANTQAAIGRYDPLHIEAIREEGVQDLGGWMISKAFLDALEACNPLKEIKRSRAACLVIHGDADETVGVEDAREYMQLFEAQQRPCELNILEGADHAFQSMAWTRHIAERSCHWFKTHLGVE